jgi:SAM-dependent methyltransferase
MSPYEISTPAQEAYASIAPYWDRFTAGYAYEPWLAEIEARARRFGLRGRRVLDVACGTGGSFAPLLRRGYRVSACDISPEMLAEAGRKFADQLENLFVADMRALPALGEFDLLTCLDDAVNYLLSDDDLVAAFASAARVLAPGGIYVFDVNSLSTYRTAFAQAIVREDGDAVFCWRGRGSPRLAPGEATSATIDAFVEVEDGLWRRLCGEHVQRHHPPAAVRAALEVAGLDCVAVAGQRVGGRLEDAFDEAVNNKLVYFARRRDAREEVV